MKEVSDFRVLSTETLHKYAIEEVLEEYSFPERFDTERSLASRRPRTPLSYLMRPPVVPFYKTLVAVYTGSNTPLFRKHGDVFCVCLGSNSFVFVYLLR